VRASQTNLGLASRIGSPRCRERRLPESRLATVCIPLLIRLSLAPSASSSFWKNE
jgi:hypothetical protein